jgi:hypothetical protein
MDFNHSPVTRQAFIDHVVAEAIRTFFGDLSELMTIDDVDRFIMAFQHVSQQYQDRLPASHSAYP